VRRAHPGTSRSGAHIIGAMVFGLSRKAATEFSFFLGHPHADGRGRLFGLQAAHLPQRRRPAAVRVGLVFAFFSALLCIRWLIRYVSSHDFRVFALVPIAFGAVVLLTAWGGWVDWKD
jgi:undecaprenyl-diphosphatase